MDKAKISYEEANDKTLDMINEIHDVCSLAGQLYTVSMEDNELELAAKCLAMRSAAITFMKESGEVLRYFGNKARLEKQRKVSDE